MSESATIADIRRGDVFTWAGKRLIACADVMPSTFPESVDVQHIKYRPPVNGVYELGADLIHTDAIVETTPVEIHERGGVIRHVTEEIRDEIPVDQALGHMSYIARARQRARREFDERDEDFRLAIRQALHSGASVAEIRRITGLSRERVYQIRDDRR